MAPWRRGAVVTADRSDIARLASASRRRIDIIDVRADDPAPLVGPDDPRPGAQCRPTRHVRLGNLLHLLDSENLLSFAS